MKCGLLFLFLGASWVHAETAVGGAVALLARQQAGGSFRINASPQLRVHQKFTPFLLGAATYDFTYEPSLASYGMRVDTHQLTVRAIGRLALPRSFLDIELGPTVRLDHSVTVANNVVESNHARVGVGGVGALFLTVPFERLEFRVGTEIQYSARLDIRFAFGLMWWLS